MELEKIVNFSFRSKQGDKTSYDYTLRFKRRTPRVEADIKSLKNRLLEGIPPATREIDSFFETIAVVSQGVVRLDDQKRDMPNTWVQEVLDIACLEEIHQQWLEYQLGFYPELKAKLDAAKASDVSNPG